MNLATVDPAAWIIVCILSAFMLIFLILASVLIVRLLKLAHEIDKVIEKSQLVANKADDIVENVKNLTSAGTLAKNFLINFIEDKFKRSSNNNKKK